MQLGEFTLRPFQIDIFCRIRESVRRQLAEFGNARVLVFAPCGFGKTIVSSAIMGSALEKGQKSAFLVSGRKLVKQKSRTLTKAGINHAILMDGFEFYHSLVNVVSIDTHRSRVDRKGSVPAIDPIIWCVDESHRGMVEYVAIIEGGKVCIGFSATPVLQNGKCMGGFWRDLVLGPGYSQLIESGLLVPCRAFGEVVPDMSGLKKHDGDWSEKAVGELFNRKELVGSVVRDWQRWGEGRPTLGYASSVKQSIGLCEAFNGAGIPAAHVDADTPDEEREQRFSELESGRLKVVWNVGVLTTGVDITFASCLILAFATDSVVKYLQVVGRGLRIHEGKTDCIVIDHGGNVHRHGWPTEDREWKLSFEGRINDIQQKARDDKYGVRESNVIGCPKCGAQRQSGPKCLNCGFEHKKTGMRVEFRDGRIGPLPRRKRPKKTSDHQKVWCQCIGWAANSGRTVKQACIVFHRRTKLWPEKANVFPLPAWEKMGLPAADVWPGFRRAKKGTT